MRGTPIVSAAAAAAMVGLSLAMPQFLLHRQEKRQLSKPVTEVTQPAAASQEDLREQLHRNLNLMKHPDTFCMEARSDTVQNALSGQESDLWNRLLDRLEELSSGDRDVSDAIAWIRQCPRPDTYFQYYLNMKARADFYTCSFRIPLGNSTAVLTADPDTGTLLALELDGPLCREVLSCLQSTDLSVLAQVWAAHLSLQAEPLSLETLAAFSSLDFSGTTDASASFTGSGTRTVCYRLTLPAPDVLQWCPAPGDTAGY